MDYSVKTLREVGFLQYMMKEVYGKDFMNHHMEWSRYNRLHRIFWTDENLHLRRKVDMMLNFKNASGEIVMTEKDNGDLSIHDDVLKESLKEQISLEEAKKKAEKGEK